jgi:hypothetical protein
MVSSPGQHRRGHCDLRFDRIPGVLELMLPRRTAFSLGSGSDKLAELDVSDVNEIASRFRIFDPASLPFVRYDDALCDGDTEKCGGWRHQD